MRFKTRQIVENGLTANKTKINIQSTDKQRNPFLCIKIQLMDDFLASQWLTEYIALMKHP